jgi:1-deoxy-D-xylulose-5-phosphate reductoisomerase
MLRKVAIFGATGAIGAQALELVQGHPDHYCASVLAADRDVEGLAALCIRHRPELAIIADPALESALARRLAAADVRCEIASGPESMAQAASSALGDTVIAAIAGLAGIGVALAAARAGKHLLLAHQESAVIAGALLRQALNEGGGEVVPFDPGLFAASQCICANPASPAERLVLAGPGGPLLRRRRAELMTVTPEQLCKPSDRGTQCKAAVDSASLMDRGLQLTAAHYLFQTAPEQMEVLIHPQGEVCAQVAYTGGDAQLQPGPRDRHEVLSQALAWPQTLPQIPFSNPLPAFEKPDMATFRCLALAYQALRAGGDAPAILNAANAVAVEAFLAGSWPFLSIADLIEQVLTELPPQAVVDIQTLSDRDRAAREAARRVLRNAC